ncbi:MAG: PPOX class F420-dependent oxidoreductase [Solirubrobacteraceae bacterium]
MTTLDDPAVRALLEAPNCAVLSTVNADGSIHSTVVWIDLEDDGALSVNSAVGRVWPTNLERDPRVTVLVYDAANPYEYVEIRGRAEPTTDGADEQIDRLAKKYIGQDTYPFRQPGEQRVRFVVTPERARHQKQ